MNIKEVYKEIPVGRAKNLTGQIFGDFTVQYRTSNIESNSKEGHWVCQCNICKNYKIKTQTALKKNPICECRNNLVGQVFGRLTVLYLTNKKTHNRGRIYHCQCECGNEKDIPAETLRKGESKSCGCLQKEVSAENGRKSRIDLTGQRFGKLVALYPIYSGKRNQHTKWHCKCDCGNECDIDLGNLRQGFSQSCGCTVSKQEENIIKLLTKNNIPFKYQYRFLDFKIKEFDFYIQDSYIIEFDGMQHFKPMGYGSESAEEKMKRTRQSDLIKNKYCFEHNIPIIRIPYDVEYTIEDLKIETTKFLLTPENEKQYYNR